MDAYLVDSFTDSAFRGNPAGVVLLDAPAEDAWMRSVASEFNQAETAFVVVGGPRDEPKPLRWFTPTTEVDLCGHATLATAHVLGGDQRFTTRSGELTCRDAGGGWIEMDFPSAQTDQIDPPAELDTVLPGITVRSTARSGSWLLVEAGSAAEIRELTPRLSELERLPDQNVNVIVTASGDRDGLDFISRIFAPRIGIPEDPVTGAAHCVLAPWWSAKLGINELTAEQASARGGTVRMALRGPRVSLLGQARTTLSGTLLV